MGRVSTSLPTTIGALKTAYGATGTRTLRAFIPGGSFANTNTAGYSGYIPTSGTITLRQYRGATNLNVTWSGSNTAIYVDSNDVAYGGGSAFASASIMVCANGILQVSAINDGFPSTTNYTNAWLMRDGSISDATVAGNWEVLFVKTGGDTAFGSNNTWLRCDTNREVAVAASRSGSGSDSNTIKMRMKFRRFDNSTELANVYVDLQATAVAFTGVEP